MDATIREFTDTERLDWVLVHGADFDYTVQNGQIDKQWVRWYENSEWHVAYGKTRRECIDNALRMCVQ